MRTDERRFDRRGFLKAMGLGAASALLPRGLFAAEASGRRPNIVFIMMDDLGWRDVGFMGSKYYETPNIDSLARQGVVFTNAYTCGPNCAPTRACLMSGQYTPRHGVYTVGTGARGNSKSRKLIPIPNKTELRTDIVTIAESLKSAGYATASVGKWHLGDGPDVSPTGQGFDVYIGGCGAAGGHFRPYKQPGLQNLDEGPEGEYLTDRLTDEAIKIIEKNRDKPFFVYLPHYAVHTPIQAKKAITAKYQKKQPDGGQKNAAYAAMIESADEGVGRIMSKLDELKLAENTVVFFYSDNGGAGGITSNAPLRGVKGMLYEGGVRVPLAVRWPGVVEAGSTCDVPVNTVDFYPTFLETSGADRPANQVLDGTSTLPLLKGEENLDRGAIFWHFPGYLEGKNAELNDPHFRTRPAGAIRKGDWKLQEFFEDGRVELYNLKDDMSETRDLAKANPEKTRELYKELEAWRKSVGAVIPTKQNPEYTP